MFWSYTMTGIAYDRSGSALRNELIIIGTDTLRTDASGGYSINFTGYTCDRGRSFCRKANVRMKWLTLARPSVEKTSRVKNEWKKYGVRCIGRRDAHPDHNTQRKDLYFQ